ncbi:eukaryotic translation initiation factor 3 subunit I [Neodiprion pinetum]|uniref:Eukaryotic translation initiation factor 3 subunit I n=1 Tax=Neodiprion lecontei TaxID=441921 RepID=A0A6J0BL47_NEOLC|nr:eukaryotic translation initiation factor 3 subunit I [Neodiprion lecontei]XP_046468404.1 eukaryotic translation initiation factor 3 subunit I [Neodiprion pinetum]
MKPLMLHGHERAITKIKYNREGDLLFSASKDKKPNVWYSLNGERLGTFNGHNGSVWCIDVNWDTTRFLSGSGDNTLCVWDCQTGKVVGQLETNSSVRTCSFSYSGNLAVYSTDKALGYQCEMFIIDARDVVSKSSQENAIRRIPINGPRISAILWGALDETIITGHEDGEINLWDMRTGKKLNSIKSHKNQINDMQTNKDGTMFVTACKDHTAKLFDSESLVCLKTYKTERPVNSATISPILDHVVLGGGQDAMDVTTTSARHGKFDSRFFHLVFEEEFARLKGHFGPINSLAFHPNGRSYSTGGEDGYIRINTFDQSYFDFHFEY